MLEIKQEYITTVQVGEGGLTAEASVYPTLYRRDAHGRIRTWRMERAGNWHRVVSGLKGGALTASDWTKCKARSQVDDVQQAVFEVKANYRHQLERLYFEREDQVDEPRFFAPMLAQKYELKRIRGHSSLIAQPKLDGIRCIARADGLWSRQGKPITAVPHIVEYLAPFFARFPEAILDGELYNHQLKDDFNAISSMVRKQTQSPDDEALARRLIEYHVYDYPSAVGDMQARGVRAMHDLPGFGVGSPIRWVESRGISGPTPQHIVDALDHWHAKWLEDGYEGSMVRLLGADYEDGRRSYALLKRKDFQDEEFQCLRIEAGEGNWAGKAKRVYCRDAEGREFKAGIKGNMARAKELLTEDHKVVTVRYFRRTPDGVPRFGVVTKFHGSERTL